MSAADVLSLVIGVLTGLASSTVFVLALFIGFCCCRREVLPSRNRRFRVRFEPPRVPGLIQSEIDARVAAELQRAIGAPAQMLDSRRGRLGQLSRRSALDPVLLLILDAPFHP